MLDVSITRIGSRLQRPVDDVLHPLSLAALLVLQGVALAARAQVLPKTALLEFSYFLDRLTLSSQIFFVYE